MGAQHWDNEMAETPNTVHGRLLEAVHISGYSFERACSELEWLLEADRWKLVGDGFENPEDFLATVDLSDLKIDAPHRKRLAKKLTAVLAASQRSIAKAVGASHTQIQRDLGTNVPKEGNKVPESNSTDSPDGTSVPPGSGREAAEMRHG